MNRATRALGLAAELTAIAFGGLLELAAPKDYVVPEALGHDPNVREWWRFADTDCGAPLADAEGEYPPKWWLIDSTCDCSMLGSGPHDCPEPSPTVHTSGDHSAGAGATPPVTAPAEPLAKWLTPAVLEILAEHVPSFVGNGTYCGVLPSLSGERHFIPGDMNDWREHVAELIAAHIANCLPAAPK